jgi:hypothetical protein
MTREAFRRVNLSLDARTIAKAKVLCEYWGQSFSSLVRYFVKDAYEAASKAPESGRQNPANK